MAHAAFSVQSYFVDGCGALSSRVFPYTCGLDDAVAHTQERYHAFVVAVARAHDLFPRPERFNVEVAVAAAAAAAATDSGGAPGAATGAAKTAKKAGGGGKTVERTMEGVASRTARYRCVTAWGWA